jgi:hypothetical protein
MEWVAVVVFAFPVRSQFLNNFIINLPRVTLSLPVLPVAKELLNPFTNHVLLGVNG